MSRPVVVGYEGGRSSERVLERALERARDTKAELIVVAVLDMPLNPEGPQNFGTLDDSPARMIPLVEPPALVPVLDAARRQVERAGARAEFVWAAGEAAQEILDVARERNASVIVVGSHHHGLFGALFGGDVAGGIQHSAECEVLVVEPD
jgi:nucleotide-binding universal stress UspA family protein